MTNQTACNENCFNCKYDDCVLDDLKRERKPPKKEKSKRAEKSARYYQAHKEQKKAYSKKYYYAHWDKIAEKRRKTPEGGRVRKTLVKDLKVGDAITVNGEYELNSIRKRLELMGFKISVENHSCTDSWTIRIVEGRK